MTDQTPLTPDELIAWDGYAAAATRHAPSCVEGYVWGDDKLMMMYHKNGIVDMAAFAAMYADAMIVERRKRTAVVTVEAGSGPTEPLPRM